MSTSLEYTADILSVPNDNVKLSCAVDSEPSLSTYMGRCDRGKYRTLRMATGTGKKKNQ